MRYIWQHIGAILEEYTGEAPLHHFLKAYYRRHPKLGSRDRRVLSDAVYAWYRCSKAFAGDMHTIEEQLLAALFLCGLKPKAFFSSFPEAWNALWDGNAQQRLALLISEGYAIYLDKISPDFAPLSKGIGREEWLLSMMSQPRLFLRIRKNAEKIGRVLEKASLPYEWITPSCLALPNGSDIDQLILADAYVVQDASSQATGAFFSPAADEYWWDCCSGAGGKSLLLKDLKPGVRLLSSDVRESILRNLRERFALYDYPVPKTAVLDAADKDALAKRLDKRRFDGIICDVPCTGSGTWARTPESLYFFDPETIKSYAEKGEHILRNAVDYIKPGGKIVYITCSVFYAENEAVVEKIASEHDLEINTMQLINGIAQKADSLFVATLTRS